MHHSPHAKGRLLLPNSPALLTPWPPKPPALKCFLAPSPAAWPVGGGPPGGTTMMPEHPQCHGEPHSCPCPWGAPGLPPKACRSDGSAQTCRLGQGLLPPPTFAPLWSHSTRGWVVPVGAIGGGCPQLRVCPVGTGSGRRWGSRGPLGEQLWVLAAGQGWGGSTVHLPAGSHLLEHHRWVHGGNIGAVGRGWRWGAGGVRGSRIR